MTTFELGDQVAFDTMPEYHGSVVCIHVMIDADTNEVVRRVYGVAWEGDHDGNAGHVPEERLVPSRDVTADDVLDIQLAVDALVTPEDADFLLDVGVAPW